jgi:hypothetical protein
VPESASSDRDANGVVASGLAVLAVEGLLPVLGAPTGGSGRTERAACPRLASVARWDVAELARTVRPGVDGGLEELTRLLGVPPHPGQEVWAVAQVFRHAVERDAAAVRWSTSFWSTHR